MCFYGITIIPCIVWRRWAAAEQNNNLFNMQEVATEGIPVGDKDIELTWRLSEAWKLELLKKQGKIKSNSKFSENHHRYSH